MRLVQYLTEAKVAKSKFYERFPEAKQSPEFYEWYSQMYKDCKPFLDTISNKGFLYRGMMHDTGLRGSRVPRIDRVPKDTVLAIHHELDRHLEDQFDWKPRSQGVFTTTSYNEAESYGDVYVVFPSGKFKYMWAKGISDSFRMLDTSAIINYFAKMHNVKDGRELYLMMYGPNGKINNKGYWYITDYRTYPTTDITSDVKDEKGATKDIRSKTNMPSLPTLQWHSESFKANEGSWEFKNLLKSGISDPNNHDYDEFREYMVGDVLDKEIKYQDDNLSSIIDGYATEVIVKCDKYYYLLYDSVELNWLEWLLKNR